MKKLLVVLSFLVITGCSVGQKCTYTQDGTKISKDLPTGCVGIYISNLCG